MRGAARSRTSWVGEGLEANRNRAPARHASDGTGGDGAEAEYEDAEIG